MEIIKSFIKPSKIINYIFYIICIIGFCYQVYLIFCKYMLGKTAVNIDVKVLIGQTLSAITVCIPAFISIPKISNSNDFNQSHYQDYFKLVNEYKGKFTDEVKQNLKEIYGNITKNNKKMVNIKQLFQISPTHESIYIDVYGQNKSMIKDTYITNFYRNFNKISESPIYSFVIPGNYPLMKCFTYFSAIKVYWNSFHFDIEQIKFSIQNIFIQYSPIDKYYIAIHSPHKLPSFTQLDYIEVKPNAQCLL